MEINMVLNSKSSNGAQNSVSEDVLVIDLQK